MFFKPCSGIPDIHSQFFRKFTQADIVALKGFERSPLLLIQVKQIKLIT